MRITKRSVGTMMFILLFVVVANTSVEKPTMAADRQLEITQYGATANDATDDSTAIKNTVDAAVAGDTIFIPNGVFSVSSSTPVKSGIKIEGQSQNGSVLRFTGTEVQQSLFDLTGLTNVEMTKLTIDGNNNDYLRNGLYAQSASNLLIHLVTLKDFTWHDEGAFGPHGILFSGVNNTEVSDSTFHNMGVRSGGGSAMRIGYGSSRVKILRNNIANSGEGGIRCNVDCTEFTISNNTVTGSGFAKEGLSIECYNGCSRFVVEDNKVDTFLSMAGCDYSATRRNIISDKTGRHITIGLEGASSNSIYTDNIIDDGHCVGLSTSCTERYQFFGYNVFRAENMSGAQLQGDAGQVKYQYYYKNDFLKMPLAHANPTYPGLEGNGFSINGNTDYLDFENCNFNDNARYGVEISEKGNVNHISMVNCKIQNNGLAAFTPWQGYSGFEMINCTVNGNGDNRTPKPSSFYNKRPVAMIKAVKKGLVGVPYPFSSASHDLDGSITHVLWDFGDGVPTDLGSTSHVYNKPGAYRVTMIVWDNHGRGARAEKRIVVSKGELK